VHADQIVGVLVHSSLEARLITELAATAAPP